MKETSTRRLFRLLFKVLSYRAPAIPVPPPGITLANVTVVNPGQERLAGKTITVAGNRITHITPYQPGTAACSGDIVYSESFVLPGLMDMHVHVPPPLRDLSHLLFLSHGVTTIREVGDADGTTWQARRRIQAGETPGPRYFTCGPVLDGDPPFLPTSWVVHDAGQAQEVVETLAAQGADFIKIHHKISAPALAALREAAAAHGLRIVGHIPISVPFDQAHVWDVQHLDGMVPYPQPPEGPMDYQHKWVTLDPARIDAYVQTALEQEMVHTPTLAANLGLIRMADPKAMADPALQLLPRYYREVIWNRQSGPPIYRSFSNDILGMMKRTFARAQEVVHRLYQAGVRIHTGTDTVAVPFTVPGLSLQEELDHLVDAGLSPEDAWVAGTRAPGASLGTPLLGTVQEDAPADLAIFGQDPTRDLSALCTLQGVVAQGRFYSQAALDHALACHRERYERPLFRALTTALLRVGMQGMPAGN